MTGSTQTSQSNTAQSASPQFDEYEFCVFLVGQLQSVKLTPVVQGISLEFSSEVKKRGFLGASFYISFALRGQQYIQWFNKIRATLPFENRACELPSLHNRAASPRLDRHACGAVDFSLRLELLLASAVQLLRRRHWEEAGSMDLQVVGFLLYFGYSVSKLIYLDYERLREAFYPSSIFL